MLLWWIRREKAHFSVLYIFYILCVGSFFKVNKNKRMKSERVFQPVVNPLEQ